MDKAKTSRTGIKNDYCFKSLILFILEKNIFSGENNLFDEAPENILVTKTKNIY